MHTIYRYAFVAGFLATALFAPSLALSQTDSPPSATIQAAFDHNETSGTWSLSVTGSSSAEGATITHLSLLGTNASGTPVGEISLDNYPGNELPATFPFSRTFQIPQPDPDWIEMRIQATVSGSSGSAEVVSSLFPVIWNQPVLIDHAITGSELIAPNYGQAVYQAA